MATFLRIVQLLPALIGAVKAVEEALPLPGQGKSKLDTVIGIINDTVSEVDKLLPQIAAVIGRIVNLFNAAGVFPKA